MPSTANTNPARITLIPGFTVTRGELIEELRSADAKLVAFLALQGKSTERSVAASTLWPFVSDSRAAANLRTVMWRIGNVDDALIGLSGTRLRLDPSAEVDLRDHQRFANCVLNREPLETMAARLSGHGDETDNLSPDELSLGVRRMIRCLTGDLLISWFDDWLTLHQERWRQLRLHALDALSLQLTGAGHHAAAIDAATAAVAADPLRESGYRALIIAHLAEGNVSEVVRTHERYCTVLEEELGIAPSLQMYELVSQATGTASTSGHAAPKMRARARPPVTQRAERGIGPDAGR